MKSSFHIKGMGTVFATLVVAWMLSKAIWVTGWHESLQWALQAAVFGFAASWLSLTEISIERRKGPTP